MRHGDELSLDNALQYWLQYEALGLTRVPRSPLVFCLQIRVFCSGAEGIRTPDLRRAKAALSQLSYGPGMGVSLRAGDALFNARRTHSAGTIRFAVC